MKIVFVSSEIIPFASSGGLGDVAAALPKALAKENIDIFRIMPLYGCIDQKKYSLEEMNIDLDITFGPMNFKGFVYKQEYDQVTTFFIKSNDFFNRNGLYGEENEDYSDNFERFLFFQKSVVELIDKLKLEPDIVHCNDWHTSLIPMMLKFGVRGVVRSGKEKSLITIHNLAHQGWFSSDKFYMTQFPLACFSPDCLEYYNQINCFKGGLIEADAVNAVSPTYSKEILTDKFGNKLEGVLNTVKDKLTGILNGVDYERWNPETDNYIKNNFSVNQLEGKAICKKDIQEFYKLPVNSQIPILSMVSRLTSQKGLDILNDSIDEIMNLDLQIIFLGTGDKHYEDAIRYWAKKWPNKISASIEFSSDQAHRIFAGSDLFLMPSIFEPCGQSQIYSMRYGTLPLAFATGGLLDTITDYPKKGSTGFLFYRFDKYDFVEKLKYSLEIYKESKKWNKIVKRAMTADFSVNKMAKDYIKLYKKIINQ